MSFWSLFNFWSNRNRSARTPAPENPVAQAVRSVIETLETRQLLTTTVGMSGSFSPAAIAEGGSAATFYVARSDSNEDYS